ncbi:MAG: cyclic nucleotide-binding domain-containing protein [Firmicutes bacterium]|jgi:CRP-like cAMP-binding protein|nr:cyclic nucleotide-binding domain-containing protein [Bacillota bacterium]
MSDIKAILSKVPLFKQLPDEAVTLLSECAEEVSFEAETQILTEGAMASTFYVVKSGEVSLQVQQPQSIPLVIQTINGNSLLGLSWISPPYQWSFDAIALDKVEAVEFHAACVREKLQAHPEYGFLIMQSILGVFLERLQATRTRMLDIYGVTKEVIPGD